MRIEKWKIIHLSGTLSGLRFEKYEIKVTRLDMGGEYQTFSFSTRLWDPHMTMIFIVV